MKHLQKPFVLAKPKKSNQLAKDYLIGNIQESHLTIQMVLQPKSDVSSDEVALLMLGDLIRTLQLSDPKVAVLPWYIKERSSLPPLLDHSSLSFMETSKFCTKYAHCCNRKFDQASWFNLALAHMFPHQHLLSDDDSNRASWNCDNECQAFLSTVQGSDNTIPLGKLLYSGPFLDAKCITEQLQQVCAAKSKAPIRVGW